MDYTQKHYAVLNTDTRAFATLGGLPWTLKKYTGNDWVTSDVEEAKEASRILNEAMRPEYQTYTVVTLTFDTEI